MKKKECNTHVYTCTVDTGSYDYFILEQDTLFNKKKTEITRGVVLFSMLAQLNSHTVCFIPVIIFNILNININQAKYCSFY